MFDFVILISFVWSVAAIVFAVEYYRHLSKVKSEYERAKEAFNQVLLSFSRELKRVAENVETVAYKVEALSAKSEEALDRAKKVEGNMENLETKITATLENWNKISVQVSDLEKQISDITASHKEIVSKVSSLEEKTRQVAALPESGIEAVIPIKREKALAHLTETELAVLEMLAAEGPKTAPEIKDRIKLSREHTARLMKKLYEEGYLERDAGKIPFKYSVKKELEKLLKKTETEAV